jgi:FkbM family methyltransferase
MSRSLIGLAIRAYRATPLHPRCGAFFARLLSLVERRAEAVTVETAGFRMELDLREVVDSQVYYTGEFEPETVETIDRLVRPGDVALDVGANVGFVTLTLAVRVGEAGRVYAFEPTERAFQRLARNLSLNSFPQVRALRLGVSDREGRTQARIRSSYRTDGIDSSTEQAISLVTLDLWAAREGLDRVDFIKIDTDGMEVQVFRGARATLERLRPGVFFELVPQAISDAGESAEELVRFLDGLGYRLLHQGTLEPWSSAVRALEATRRGACVNVVAWPAERPLPGA